MCSITMTMVPNDLTLCFTSLYRLGDFKDTPSSRLTIDEFLNIDLEQEHDPPCFLEAKKKAKQLQIVPVVSN